MSLGLGGVIVLLAVAGVFRPAPASAHASVVSSTPVDGDHLTQGPAEVDFTLDQAVSIVTGSPQIIDDQGRHYPIGEAELRQGRTVVALRLAHPLPTGSYLATTRLISQDTHVVSVSDSFTVGNVKAGALLRAGSTGGTSWEQLASYPLKFLVYLGAVGSGGVLVTTALLWPGLTSRRRWRRTFRWGGVLFVVGLLGRFGTEAAQRSGGLTQVTGGTIKAIFTDNTGFGLATVLAIVVTAANLTLPAARNPTRLRIAALVTAASTVLAVTYGGHGADPDLFPLPLLLTFGHVYAVLAWLGGVTVIAVELGDWVRPAPWHRYAVAHVVLVVLTGTGLALLRVPAPGALLDTRYGIALLVKVLLVLLVLGAAGITYRHLAKAPAVAAPGSAASLGDEPAPSVLPRPGPVRFLGIEIALVVGIFAVTSVLSSVAPAKVSYHPSVHTTIDFGGGEIVRIRIPSSQRGPQELTIDAAKPSTLGPDPTGAESSTALAVDLSSRDANVARLPVALRAGARAGSGEQWRSVDLVVPLPGTWQVTITFDPGDGPRVAAFNYRVQ